MQSKAINSTGGYNEDYVVVGACFGHTLLRADELASYYRGYAFFAAPACVVALLQVAMWIVGL